MRGGRVTSAATTTTTTTSTITLSPSPPHHLPWQVLLKDRDVQGLSRGEAQLKRNLDTRVKKRQLTGFERDQLLSRVIGLTDADASWAKHFSRADLVVEAVFEDLGLKHRVVKQMEAVIRDDCVLATNTSALPIADVRCMRRENE